MAKRSGSSATESRRGRHRRLVMGLATLLGGRPRGFFIPHRYADRVTPCAYPALETTFAASWPAFERVLAAIDALAPELRRLGGPAPAPRFDQDWFPPLDAAAAYALVATLRPGRIVEVGSGHSTRFLARAIADRGLATDLLCIDPAPRATLRGLDLRWLECTLQQAPESCFAGLAAGDLLFVDSSHILMPGTDVDWLLNRILPVLATGVLVQVHDVFLPIPTPKPGHGAATTSSRRSPPCSTLRDRRVADRGAAATESASPVTMSPAGGPSG